MKRITFLPILLLIITLGISSCKEDNYADWKILNDAWLETHKTDAGFTETESGLCYKIIHKSVLRRPSSTSNIVVKYTGTLIDGTEFDSSDSFSANLYSSGLIQGWVEGITKINVGSRYIFYIPASLGYGNDGYGDIPPYTTLIFDVELLASEDQL